MLDSGSVVIALPMPANEVLQAVARFPLNVSYTLVSATSTGIEAMPFPVRQLVTPFLAMAQLFVTMLWNAHRYLLAGSLLLLERLPFSPDVLLRTKLTCNAVLSVGTLFL